jgi:hypothetical protein
MNDVDLAYAAGFIDAGGTIGANKYRPWIRVAGCREEPLIFLQSLFGGCIVDQQATNPNARPQRAWMLQGRVDIRNALVALRSYTLLKQEHIALMLELIDKEEPGQSRQGLTQAELDRRNKIYIRFKELNRRGKN